MNIYQENTKIREDIIDGCGNWIWPKLDTGAWNGPSREWGEHHKPNVLKYVSNFTTVIQAGGNCGLYPRLYANMFNWVYTFEPEPMNFYCLVQNVVFKSFYYITVEYNRFLNSFFVHSNLFSFGLQMLNNKLHRNHIIS